METGIQFANIYFGKMIGKVYLARRLLSALEGYRKTNNEVVVELHIRKVLE